MGIVTRRNGSKKSDSKSRKQTVEAAIKHAEQVVQASGKFSPVIYRPIAPATSRPISAKNDTPPRNPAMGLAIRNALIFSKRASVSSAKHKDINRPDSKANEQKAQAANKRATSAGSLHSQELVNAPTIVKKRKPKLTRIAPNSNPARKTKPQSKGKRAVAARKVSIPKFDKKRAKAGNDASRLAFNARQRDTNAIGLSAKRSPFTELQRKWLQAFAYLQRFEESNPDAPDILSARRHLAEVEAKWESQQALASDHPHYFPWPSTYASDGDGAVSNIEWREIGMLAYLGYHVGMSSALTEAQRARLLGYIFTMRLPPLNGLTYMQSWGSPETGPRLRKIAEGLAAFARNAKRRKNPSLSTAIKQWEDDLSNLRRSHYDGHFDFIWPDT